MNGIDIAVTAIKALGGVALFLYGMQILGRSLEKASGSNMEKVLRSLTGNIFKSVILGAAVTAAVQSSGATTVIVVGLVNAGIMNLSSAVGVIMGANIGTTITGQILRLAELEGGSGSFLDLLDTKVLAPAFCIVGAVILLASKRDGTKNAGEILMGVGILFTGMNAMTAAVGPLAELEGFRKLFEAMSNPLLGILAGIFVTVLLQSSSASVGILQAIASKGMLPFSAAFPIIMGTNIGTCSVPLISSLGAGKNAKRAAFVHVYFNILGTVLFLVGMYTLEYTVSLPFWNDNMNMGSIANFHTFFNVAATAVFLPCHKLLEKMAVLTVKDSPRDIASDANIPLLDERFLKSPSLAVGQALSTVITMGKTAQINYAGMRKLYSVFDENETAVLRVNEDSIDRMEDGLNAYLVKLTHCELTDYENRRTALLLRLTSEFERIGDYTMNLIESAEQMHKLSESGEPELSADAVRELNIMFDAVQEIIGMAIDAAERDDPDTAVKIEPLEEVIDYLNETLKARHVERIKSGVCIAESGINFIDLLANLERISDHCSNIGVYILSARKDPGSVINRHEYIAGIHSGGDKEFTALYNEYKVKFSL